jgi:hypothetical protein
MSTKMQLRNTRSDDVNLIRSKRIHKLPEIDEQTFFKPISTEIPTEYVVRS